jgi:predicted Zn-ribbon and HTH transcriptional regulator
MTERYRCDFCGRTTVGVLKYWWYDVRHTPSGYDDFGGGIGPHNLYFKTFSCLSCLDGNHPAYEQENWNPPPWGETAKEGIVCPVCGHWILLGRDDHVSHHISYKENKTMTVHRGCNTRLHRSETSPFKPVDKPSPIEKRVCSCGRRILAEDQTKCHVCREVVRVRGQRSDRSGRMLRPVNPSLMVVCKNCGFKFEGRSRTTCPKCRAFFR